MRGHDRKKDGRRAAPGGQHGRACWAPTAHRALGRTLKDALSTAMGLAAEPKDSVEEHPAAGAEGAPACGRSGTQAATGMSDWD